MEIPKISPLLDSLLPKARRGIDLSEDLNILSRPQLESIRQFLDTTLLRKHTSQRVLHTRNTTPGKGVESFRSEKMSLERDIEALTALRDQINRIIAS